MISEDIISDSLLQTSCETETACSKVALFSCHHCSKRLCLEHINEHNDLNIIRVEELSNDIDSLTHLLSNLGTEKSFENARTKLNIWKKENLDNIEKIYELNSNEIDRLEIELNSRLNIFKETSESTISDLRTQLSYLKKIAEISQQVISSFFILSYYFIDFSK
jgi:archaellum component FlaC